MSVESIEIGTGESSKTLGETTNFLTIAWGIVIECVTFATHPSFQRTKGAFLDWIVKHLWGPYASDFQSFKFPSKDPMKETFHLFEIFALCAARTARIKQKSTWVLWKGRRGSPLHIGKALWFWRLFWHTMENSCSSCYHIGEATKMPTGLSAAEFQQQSQATRPPVVVCLQGWWSLALPVQPYIV